MDITIKIDTVRLPALDTVDSGGVATAWGLGITFTVGFQALSSADATALQNALAPLSDAKKLDALWPLLTWRWDPHSTLLCRADGQQKPVTPVPVATLDPTVVANSQKFTLESRFVSAYLHPLAAPGLELLAFPGGSGVATSEGAPALPWPSQLASFSQLPAPLPQQVVRVTYLFRVAAADVTGWATVSQRATLIFGVSRASDGHAIPASAPVFTAPSPSDPNPQVTWSLNDLTPAPSPFPFTLNPSSTAIDTATLQATTSDPCRFVPLSDGPQISARVAHDLPSYAAGLFDFAQSFTSYVDALKLPDPAAAIPSFALQGWIASVWDSLHPSIRTTTVTAGSSGTFTLSADGSALGVELLRGWRAKNPNAAKPTDILDDQAISTDYSTAQTLLQQTDALHLADVVAAGTHAEAQCGCVSSKLFVANGDMPARWIALLASAPSWKPSSPPTPQEYVDYWTHVSAWLTEAGESTLTRLHELHYALRATDVRHYFWRSAWDQAAGSQADAKQLVAEIDRYVFGDAKHPFDLLTRQLIDASAPYATALVAPNTPAGATFPNWSIGSAGGLQDRLVDALCRRNTNNAASPAAASAAGPALALHDLYPRLSATLSVASIPAALLSVLEATATAFSVAIGMGDGTSDLIQPAKVERDGSAAHPLVFSAYSPDRTPSLLDASLWVPWFPQFDIQGAVVTPFRPLPQTTDLAAISGFGVLLRRHTASTSTILPVWRCLNAGGIVANTSPDPSAWSDPPLTLTLSGASPLAAIVIHPLPIDAAGTIQYDNNALVPDRGSGMSHAAALGPIITSAFFHGFPIDDQASADPTLFSWTRLPGLAYGCSYDALCFTIPNAGVLPAVLQASPARPTELRAPSAALDAALGTSTSGLLKAKGLSGVVYQRRVGVGRLRVVRDPAWTTAISPDPAPVFPPVPANIQPIALDFNTGPDALPSAHGASTPPKRPALLILFEPPADANANWSQPSSYSFSLLRPTIDAETLYRWHMADRYAAIDAGDATGATQWENFLEMVESTDRNLRGYTQAAVGVPASPVRKKAISHQDNVLEDPVVTHLIVRLHRRTPTTVLPEGVSIILPWPGIKQLPPSTAPADAAALFNATQADAFKIVLTIGAFGSSCSVLPDPHDAGTVDIKVPAGQVIRVTFEAATLANLPTTQRMENPTPADPPSYATFGAWSVDVEGAWSAQLGTDPATMASVRGRFAARADARGDVVVALNRGAKTPTDNMLPYLLRQYSQATVGYQVHRWDGRPIAQPPRADLNVDGESGDNSWLEWEVGQFVEQSPVKATAVRDVVVSYAPDPTLYNALLPPDVFVLFHTNTADALRTAQGASPLGSAVVTEPRERFYRFLLQLRHRYAAVYGIANDYSVQLDQVNAYSAWARAIRPARWNKPVPTPAIKLVVPLTGTASAGTETALASDLLVVINEQWGLSGGLAETLDVSVEEVGLLDDSGKLITSLPEAGPDPIIEVDTGYRFSNGAPLPVRVIGPIGQSFDTDTSAPLFVNTTFIVRSPPQLRPFGPIKLRARRVIEPRGADGYVVYPDIPFSTDPPKRFEPNGLSTVTVAADATAVSAQGWLALDGVSAGSSGTLTFRPGPDDPATPLLDAQLAYTLTPVDDSTCHLRLTPTGGWPPWFAPEANLLTEQDILVPRGALIDLRFVFVRLAQANPNATPKVGARWELAVYASPNSEPVPSYVGHLVFHGDSSTSLQDGISATLKSTSLPAPVHAVAGAAYRYSIYGAPRWCQPLPLATRVGGIDERADVAWNDVSITSDGSSFQIQQVTARLALKSWVDADDGPPFIAWKAANPKAAPLRGHFHAVFVTRRVTSADGTSETESYVGTFESGADGTLEPFDLQQQPMPNAQYFGRILLLHKSPQYRHWIPAPVPPSGSPPLSWVREDVKPAKPARPIWPAPAPGTDFWSLVFPPEQNPDDPFDTAVRIVAVSLRFG